MLSRSFLLHVTQRRCAVFPMRVCARGFFDANMCGALCTAHGTALTQSMRCLSSSSAVGSKPHIYKSELPSIMDNVNKESTLYGYVMKRMSAAGSDIPAVIQADNGKVLTYPQLMQATEYAAMALYQEGVRKGDVVCLCLLNTAMYGPLVYGTLRLGAIVSTVNAVAAASTLAYHFKTNKCKVVLGSRFFQKQLDEAVELVQRETGHTVKVMFPEEFFKTTDIPPIPKDYDGLKGATLDDTILIPFSSGTTGLPKGVQLTNRALIANTEQCGLAHRMQPGVVSLVVLPLFHIFGFTACMNTIFAFGCTQVIMSKFSVGEYVQATEKYHATINMVAPPILISLLKNEALVKRHDLSSLTELLSGSAPLGEEVVAMMHKLLPHTKTGQGYGMTEMSPVVASPMEGKTQTPGSCGYILPDTEIRVVKVDASQQSGSDPSAGVDVAPGEEGEIWVRGPQMMKGYLRDEDTAVCMQDGWFRTGDIGKILSDTQELVITDRLKELIKYKGFQVSPASLEAMLLSHPWVKDCVVFGVPDPRDVSFENPRALVMLQPHVPTKDAVRASDELYRFVMARMPPHKRLHGGVRIVEQIPRNAAGKVMRRQVRQDEVAMLKASIDGLQSSSSAA
jgi:4-coumarate--CoA ligase